MKKRFIASACHLGLSAIVVALAMCVVIGVWYPPPLFYAQDLLKIVLVLVSVDLVLGPILTFIVYNPQKPNLKFDLMVIVLIQLSALTYGVYTTFISRPIYVVYSNNRFDSVNPTEYADADLKKIPVNNPYLHFSITGPRWIGSIGPQKPTPAEKMDIEFSTQIGGGLRIMPQYYVAFDQVKRDAVRAGKRASDLDFNVAHLTKPTSTSKIQMPTVSSEQIKAVQAWLQHLNLPLEKIILLPLKGREKFAIVALNADTGAILDTLSQDPWWYQ